MTPRLGLDGPDTVTPALAHPDGATIDAVARVRSSTRRQIRGSSLLLAGRVLSRGTNFAIQILIVRYLSVSDFGAFAYALSLVSLGYTIATCGMDRAVTRFVPMYLERKEYDKLFGTLAVVCSVVVSLGIAIALGLQVLSSLSGAFVDNPQASAILSVLIFLVPFQAVDDLLVGLFAVLANPKAIFLRRNVLAPALKLAVVVLLVLSQGTVLFLAAGYLMATAIGVAICVGMLARELRSHDLVRHFSRHRIHLPWREIFAFTGPLLISDLVFVAMNSVTVVVLEHYRGLDAVAAYRAQQPIAAVNQMVLASFSTLFTPMAARMFARQDYEGVNHLYWRTAMWIAVLSFPIFALTCSLAGPTTEVLLGARYRDSAVLLALLAFGYYFNAALGFNGLTLKIYGRLHYVVVISLASVAVSLMATLVLIPRYGALGAAAGTCVAMVAHNILKQVGLRVGTGINLFEWRYLRGYLVIMGGAAGLWGLTLLPDVPAIVSLGLGVLVSWLVFRCCRHLLDVADTFPEILRVPFARQLLGL
jgi:O-antigen/teichoic acid export membrane protein